MIAAPLPPALRDETARTALANVAREERQSRLMVSIADRCGDALIEAFLKVATAYYGGRDR